MAHYKLAFLGFGNVGKALAALLLQKQTDIKTKSDVTFTVTGIATGRHGISINPDGIDLNQALALVNSGKSLSEVFKFTRPNCCFYRFRRKMRCGCFVRDPPGELRYRPTSCGLRPCCSQSRDACRDCEQRPGCACLPRIDRPSPRQGAKVLF